MGLLRLWLALAVVSGHSGPCFGLRFLDPEAAVLGFYAISGFYMARVLETRYRDRLGAFYFNRFLRIWPAYAAVLLATVAFLAWSVRRTGMAIGPANVML